MLAWSPALLFSTLVGLFPATESFVTEHSLRTAHALHGERRLSLIAGDPFLFDIPYAQKSTTYGSGNVGASAPALPKIRLDALESPPPPWLVTAGRIGGGLAGFWAAALVHELGHAVVAWGQGVDFRWPTASVNADFFLPFWRVETSGIDTLDPSIRRNIAAGGFVTSFAISETLLLTHRFPKNDAFVGGFLIYDLLNATSYTIADIVSRSQGRGGYGDIRDIAAGGVPREAVYAVLLVKSAVTLFRLIENREFQRLRYWRTIESPDVLADEY